MTNKTLVKGFERKKKRCWTKEDRHSGHFKVRWSIIKKCGPRGKGFVVGSILSQMCCNGLRAVLILSKNLNGWHSRHKQYYSSPIFFFCFFLNGHTQQPTHSCTKYYKYFYYTTLNAMVRYNWASSYNIRYKNIKNVCCSRASAIHY